MLSRWLLALLLLCCVLAHNQVPIQAPPPATTYEPGSLPAYFNMLKKMITGKVNEVDSDVQRSADEAAGVLRLNYNNIGQIGKGTWVVVVHGRPNELPSDRFLEAHTNATELYKNATMTPDIKWARLDYMTEWQVCTQWLMFRAPYFVIISDKGQSLRFFGPSQVNPNGEGLFNFVQGREWEKMPAWDSTFAPGHSSAWMVDWYLAVMNVWSEKTANIPSWVIMVASSALTTRIVQWLHR